MILLYILCFIKKKKKKIYDNEKNAIHKHTRNIQIVEQHYNLNVPQSFVHNIAFFLLMFGYTLLHT